MKSYWRIVVTAAHSISMRWRPLIMSFCRFFGLGGEVYPSRLAESDFMKVVAHGPPPQSAESSGARRKS
jgi:hypothetical protein